MSATNSFESEVLRHILLNEAILNLGDAGGLLPSVAAGSVYIALFTQGPGEAGSIVNESAFGGYARVAVARGGAGWTEANGQALNAAIISFPICTSGSETITHFGICKTLAGDDLILKAELPSPGLVSIDVQIQFAISTLAVNLD
jgi:hypothetical protein